MSSMKAMAKRLTDCGLEMHASKTKLVYCKDSNRKHDKRYPIVSFDFLGFTFKPRFAQNSIRGEWFANFLPAVSTKAMKAMNEKMRKWQALKKTTNTLQEIAKEINPVIRGWVNYYGTFYKTKMKEFISVRRTNLFVHWSLLNSKPTVGKSERHKSRDLRAVLTESQVVIPGFTY